MRETITENGILSVCDDGTVYRIKNGKKEVATQFNTCRNGKYKAVTANIKGKQKRFYVHRLVASAFVPNPESKPQVNHKDGNGHNNRAENLEWVTAAENIQHAYGMGLINHHRSERVCMGCGAEVADRSESGLCSICYEIARNKALFEQNIILYGVIEFNKKVRSLTNAKIAEMTGYKKDTIDSFMCGKRLSQNIAYAICDALGINKSLWNTDM